MQVPWIIDHKWTIYIGISNRVMIEKIYLYISKIEQARKSYNPPFDASNAEVKA